MYEPQSMCICTKISSICNRGESKICPQQTAPIHHTSRRFLSVAATKSIANKMVLPEQVHVHLPHWQRRRRSSPSKSNHPHKRSRTLSPRPDSLILEYSMLDFDVYMLKRTSPTREKSPPPPPPTAESTPDAATPP
jgi:hypothetical protein